MNAVSTSLFVAALWGIGVVIQKYILYKQDARVFLIAGATFYSFAVAGFVLINWKSLKEASKTLTAVQIFWIAASALVCGFMANLIYLKVLQKNDSYLIAALVSVSPIFTMLFAWLLLKERITGYGVLGVLLVVAGVTCLVVDQKHKNRRLI